MILLPNSVIRFLMVGCLLAPPAAHAQVMRHQFKLDTSLGFCNAATAETSCVRYNGDSAFFPADTSFLIDADFANQVGDKVPVFFLPGFFLPDIQLALGETIEIDAPSEPTGTWDLVSGVFDIDLGPLEFPNAVSSGTVALDPFDASTAILPGIQCLSPIPPVNGSPLSGGEMTLVGRGCVPVINETFFMILKGTVSVVPEPGGSLLAGAAVLALLVLTNRYNCRRRTSQ